MGNIVSLPESAGSWRPLSLSSNPENIGPPALGQRTTQRDRSHLPTAYEQREDAVHARGPVMRVTWRPIPRLENPAHQHLISQESADGARSKMYLLNHIARAFGAPDYEHLYWADMTAPTINTIMAELRDLGYKESTRNAYLSAIKSTAKEAWVLGQMELEIFERIRNIKRIKSQRITHGTSKSIDLLIDLVECVRDEGKLTSERNALLLEMMVFTGMRRREVRGIRIPDHIYTDKKDILIQGKGGKDRWARLPAEVWENLMFYLDEERTWEPGALFCAYWNKCPLPRISPKGIDVSNINRILEAAVKLYVSSREEDYQEKDATLTPHDIRRSFATALHEMGHSVREIQVVLGHATMDTTEGYLHDDKDSYRESASKTMDMFLEKSKEKKPES